MASFSEKTHSSKKKHQSLFSSLTLKKKKWSHNIIILLINYVFLLLVTPKYMKSLLCIDVLKWILNAFVLVSGEPVYYMNSNCILPGKWTFADDLHVYQSNDGMIPDFFLTLVSAAS